MAKLSILQSLNKIFVLTKYFVTTENKKLTDKINFIESALLDEIHLRDSEVRSEIYKPKDYVVLKDQVSGFNYTIQMIDGVFNIGKAITDVKAKVARTLYDGDALRPCDFTYEVTYSDGSIEIIQPDNVEFHKDVTIYTEIVTVNHVTVDITYSKFDKTFYSNVHVDAKEFIAAKMLIDFEYVDNGDGTYTITDWKGTYQGKESKRMIIPDNSHIKIGVDE